MTRPSIELLTQNNIKDLGRFAAFVGPLAQRTAILGKYEDRGPLDLVDASGLSPLAARAPAMSLLEATPTAEEFFGYKRFGTRVLSRLIGVGQGVGGFVRVPIAESGEEVRSFRTRAMRVNERRVARGTITDALYDIRLGFDSATHDPDPRTYKSIPPTLTSVDRFWLTTQRLDGQANPAVTFSSTVDWQNVLKASSPEQGGVTGATVLDAIVMAAQLEYLDSRKVSVAR